MKKMLPAALLALVVSGLAATSSFAGALGLIPHGCCFGCCCGCKVCIRPYNAFTPVVCGHLCADGCFPFGLSSCGGGFAGYGGGCCGFPAYGGDACGPLSTCDGGPGSNGCNGNLPPANGAPMSAVYPQPSMDVYAAGYHPAAVMPYAYPQAPGYGVVPQMPVPQAAPANVPAYWK
jgi:hypothetical protein